MLDFLIPKNRIQYYDLEEVPIETFEILGINQINPYCKSRGDKECFITLVTIANTSKEYDEKEAMVLTSYFTVKRCPRCKKISLIPTKIKINQFPTYLKNEEKIAYGNYFSSRYNFPTTVSAYCNSCSTCFEYLVKNRELWIKEAKKLKEKNIIGGEWETYRID